jgi:hypothetical protein
VGPVQIDKGMGTAESVQDKSHDWRTWAAILIVSLSPANLVWAHHENSSLGEGEMLSPDLNYPVPYAGTYALYRIQGLQINFRQGQDAHSAGSSYRGQQMKRVLPK